MKKKKLEATIYKGELPKNLELRPASVKVRIKYKDGDETKYYTSSFKNIGEDSRLLVAERNRRKEFMSQI